MSSVDNRIVEMQFNNKRFEENAKQSMSTLDRLKEKLNFKSQTKELNNLQESADSFNLSHIANALDNIGDKFTLLGNLGQQAMQRISNAAITAGVNLVKSISVDQISAGMAKYEEETNTVQTLLASLKPKGKTKEDIYAGLDILAKYSDETSYSYNQMAGAVSNFVNAGQDFNKSIVAMQGIANVAAKAGVSISDAQIAFRNFSDAMGKGHFELMDWRSIQNIHMDTEWFVQSMLDTAAKLGKLEKDENGLFWITTGSGKKKKREQVNTGNYREFLKDGIFDRDVIMQNMEQWANDAEAFAAAQNAKTFTDVFDAVKDSVSTGWKTTFRLIFGDIEEAIDLFTPMANEIIEFTSAIDEMRNTMFGKWKDLGGRDNMLGALRNVWDTFIQLSNIFDFSFMSVFYATWEEMEQLGVEGGGFWNIMGYRLKAFTEGIEEATQAFKRWLNGMNPEDGKRRVGAFQSIFSGILSIANIVIMAVKGVFTFISTIFDMLKPTFDAILSLFSLIGDDLLGLNKDLKKQNGFTELAKNLAAIFKPLTDRLPKVINKLKQFYLRLKDIWNNNKRVVAFRNSIKNLFNAFVKFIPNAIDSVVNFGKKFIDMIKNSDEWKALVDNYNKYIKPVLRLIEVAATAFNNSLADFFNMDTSDETTLWGKIKKRFSVFNNLIPYLNNIWTELKRNLPWLKDVEDWWNTDPVINEIKEWVAQIAHAFDVFLSADTSGETSIVGKIKARFEAMWEELGPWFEDKWNGYKEKYPILQQIEDTLKNLFGWGKPAEEAAQETEEQTEHTVGFLEGAWAKIEEFIGKIDLGKLGALAGAIAMLIWVYKKVKTLFGWASLGEAITETVEEIGSTFSQVKKLLKKQNMESNIRIMLGVAASIWLLGDTLTKVSKLSWEEIARGLTAMAGLFVEEGAFMVIMGHFSKSGKLGKGVKLSSMIGMAAAMWILGKALKDVSSLGWEEIGRGLTAMGGLFLESGAFMILVNRFGKTKLFDKKGTSATGMISMAVSLWLLGKALKEVSSLEWEEIGRGLTAMGGLFLETGAFMILVNRLGKTSIFEQKGASATGMIAMAYSLQILGGMLKDLAGMTWEEIGRGLTAMGGLFLESGAFMILVNRLGSTSILQHKGFSSVGVLAAAGSIKMLANTLNDLTKLSWEEIGRGLTAMAGLFVEEGAFMVIIGFLSKKDLINPGAVNITTGLLAGGIGKMGEAVAELGKLSVRQIIKGVIAVGAIEVLLGLFVGVMGRFETVKISKSIGMVVVAGAMYAMAKAFEPLAQLSLEQIKNGVIALASVMVALGVFCVAMQKVKVSIKTILGTIVSAIALAALMVAFAFSLTLVKDIDSATILAFAGAMLLISAAMVPLAAALKATSQISIGAAIKGAAVIAVTVTLIGAALSLVASLAGNALEGLGGNIAMIGSYLSLYSEMVADLNIDAMKQSIVILKELAEALVEVGMKDYGSIEVFRENMLRASADLKLYSMDVQAVNESKVRASADILKTLAGAFAEIGEKEYGNLNTFRSNLTRMGGSIKLFSDDTSGIDIEQLKTTSGALKEIATNLSGFPEVSDIATSIGNIGGAIKLYSDSVNGTDLTNTPDAPSIKAVFDVIKEAIPPQEDMAEVAAYGTEENGSNLTLFSVGLTNLGTAVSSFSESVKDMDFSNITQAIDALKAISSLNTTLSTTSITSFGPFSTTLTEQKEPLSNLAEDIVVLGTALESFGNNMKKVKTEDLTAGTTALDSFARISSKLPRSKTAVARLGSFSLEMNEQQTSMSTFSEDITLLGTALESFGNNMKKVKTSDLTTGAEALGKIADINEKLPKTGGLSQWLTGTVSLANFGAQLKLLGAGARDFNDSINGGTSSFDSKKVTAAGEALKVLAEVNGKLPKTGGISSWFSGKEDLGGFGKSLTDLGAGVAGFSTGIGDTKVDDNMTSAVKFIGDLADVQVKLSGTDSWYTLGSLAEDMTVVATRLKELNSELTGITWVDTSSFEHLINFAVTQQKRIGNMTYSKNLKSIGQDLKDFFNEVWSFTENWLGNDSGKLDQVTTSVTSIFDSLNTAFENANTEGGYKAAGENVVQSFVNGMSTDESKTKVWKAVQELAKVAWTQIHPNNDQNFINIGTWIPAGLAQGIRNNQSAVVNAIVETVNAAIQAGKDILQINSPSRVFAEMGMYSSMGLAQGMTNSVGAVEKAGQSVSQSAIGAVLQGMADIQSLPLSDMDITPTIRPVLDTSDISSKAGLIDGILGGNRSIGFNTRSLEAQAQILGEGSPTDLNSVTSRISELGTKLDTLGDAITHMQIVMNNGALVGAIAPDMDKALGDRNRRAERGG